APRAEYHQYDVTVPATNAVPTRRSSDLSVSFTDVAPTVAADHGAVSAAENAAATNSGTYGDYDDAVSVSGAGVTDHGDGTWSWSSGGADVCTYVVTRTRIPSAGSTASTT